MRRSRPYVGSCGARIAGATTHARGAVADDGARIHAVVLRIVSTGRRQHAHDGLRVKQQRVAARNALRSRRRLPSVRSRSMTAASRGTGLNASACGSTVTASTSTPMVAANASAYGARARASRARDQQRRQQRAREDRDRHPEQRRHGERDLAGQPIVAREEPNREGQRADRHRDRAAEITAERVPPCVRPLRNTAP